MGFTGLICQLGFSSSFDKPAEKEANYTGGGSANDEEGIEEPEGGVLPKGPGCGFGEDEDSDAVTGDVALEILRFNIDMVETSSGRGISIAGAVDRDAIFAAIDAYNEGGETNFVADGKVDNDVTGFEGSAPLRFKNSNVGWCVINESDREAGVALVDEGKGDSSSLCGGVDTSGAH